MRNVIITMAAAMALMGCAEGAPVAEDRPRGIDGEPRAVSGGERFVLIPDDPDWQQVEADARALCEGETHCGVSGWTDAGSIPSAMPMLDREAAARAFSYSLNRDTGYERLLRDCDRWPGEDDICQAKFEPEEML